MADFESSVTGPGNSYFRAVSRPLVAWCSGIMLKRQSWEQSSQCVYGPRLVLFFSRVNFTLQWMQRDVSGMDGTGGRKIKSGRNRKGKEEEREACEGGGDRETRGENTGDGDGDGDGAEDGDGEDEDAGDAEERGGDIYSER